MEDFFRLVYLVGRSTWLEVDLSLKLSNDANNLLTLVYITEKYNNHATYNVLGGPWKEACHYRHRDHGQVGHNVVRHGDHDDGVCENGDHGVEHGG